MWINQLQRLTNEKLFWLIFSVSIIVLSPSLFSGLMGDDLLHYLLFNKPDALPLREDISLFNLFSFVDDNPEHRTKLMALSLLPWWVDPEFTWNFWRPIAEITHAIDYTYFGRQYWLMHLHSLLWFSLLLLLAARFYKLTLPTARMHWIAFACFALSASHAVTVAWLSNRHAVIASAFILSTLLLHHRFVSEHSRLSYLLALLMTSLAFLSSELGLSTGVWLFCYTLFLNKEKSLRHWLWLLPYFFIFCTWAYVYRDGNFGIRGYSSFYIDPTEKPLDFLVNYLKNLPAIIASQTWIIPADIFSAIKYPWITPLIGLLTIACLYFPIKAAKEKPLISFFITAFLLLAIPIATSPAQDRNLLQVSLAFSGILGIVLYQAYLSITKQKALKYLFYTLVMLHFLVAPLLSLPLSYTPKFFSAAGEKRAKSLDIKAGDQIIILKGNMMETIYLYPRLVELGLPLPDKIWNIGGSHSKLNVTRLNHKTLKIEAMTPFFSASDLMARDPIETPFLHNTITLNGLTIIIQSASETQLPKTLIIKHPQYAKIFIVDQGDFIPYSP